MTTTEATPEARIEQRSAQLARIDARCEEISQALGALEEHFTAAIAAGESTTDLSGQRRELLDEAADLDRATVEVRRHLDAAQAEITERETRARLAEVRAQLDEHTAQAHTRAETLGERLEGLVAALVDAARAAVEAVAEVDEDEREVARLLGLEQSLAEQVGEQPRQRLPEPRVTGYSFGQPILEQDGYRTGIPERVVAEPRVLALSRKGPTEALQALAEAAERHLPTIHHLHFT
ncbi:hypothetical protein ORV05_26300 [Amycolatopsis cynarae]|uniref:Uncharacterized protein n=1 Tax=Amycolatopsis cynarae TaxID=2995223 RepID=A0ABY7AYA8_9PSEU|nr:hypothetical protein [Amycolatopsis sp. HUAS 11-8]WAL64458.1 hypothetical protein ORV05_26300 [Amycolatopsis sp. HUAS 11-8]